MRLTQEAEDWIRARTRHGSQVGAYEVETLLSEIDALRAKLNEYRARNHALVEQTLKLYQLAKSGEPKDYINPFGDCHAPQKGKEPQGNIG